VQAKRSCEIDAPLLLNRRGAADRRVYTTTGWWPLPLSGRALLWFAVGDRSLHIAVGDGIDRARTKAHLAYEVDDIADCRRRLLADGRELVEQPPLAGYDRFHTLDPFGNRLELIGRVANTNPLDGALKRLTIIGL